jgi:hypothetical protein
VGREPLAVLATFRTGASLGYDVSRPSTKREVFFGQNAVSKQAGGVLAVGATLSVV